MAFIRWRGTSAELLTTVYKEGRSRQVRLACLSGAHTAGPEVRAEVAARFAGIEVDWGAIDVALALGPPAEQAARAHNGWPNDRLEWLHLQRRLHYWAALTDRLQPAEAERLRAAAAVLQQWRTTGPRLLEPEPAPGWDPEPTLPDPGPFPGPPGQRQA